MTSRTIGSSSTTRTVAPGGAALGLPLRMVLRRPLLAHGADRDPAQRMARGGMDHGEVEMADEECERHVHQPIVDDDGAGEAEAGVALAEPEQEPGDQEEHRERG